MASYDERRSPRCRDSQVEHCLGAQELPDRGPEDSASVGKARVGSATTSLKTKRKPMFENSLCKHLVCKPTLSCSSQRSPTELMYSPRRCARPSPSWPAWKKALFFKYRGHRQQLSKCHLPILQTGVLHIDVPWALCLQGLCYLRQNPKSLDRRLSKDPCQGLH